MFAFLFFIPSLISIAQTGDASASVQGIVRTVDGSPMAGAIVSLQPEGAAQPRTMRTDSRGSYRFADLPEGNYTLRATAEGQPDAAFGPFTLTAKEAKELDLVVISKGQKTGSADSPQFFDEPKFTVAGVADAGSGGHGSDVVQRNTETLARETASLRNGSTPAKPTTDEEQKLRDRAQREPENFEAQYQLGAILISEAKAAEAIGHLQQALRLRPQDYEAGLAMARAYLLTGQSEQARVQVRGLLGANDKPELHRLLADANERVGDPLAAVREYERAAQMDASEPNLFAWGAELLLHNALQPASEVFHRGQRAFPQSARMRVGLGVAEYAQGSYGDAAKTLCEAADLQPQNPAAYIFLGKMLTAGADPSPEVMLRLERFVRENPNDAQANYYYAFSLWKQQWGNENPGKNPRIEELLKNAVRLDPELGVAALQLGILYTEQKDYANAMAEYQKAADASPDLAEPHFRLAQAYKRAGNDTKAQSELEIYEQLSKKKTEEVERQRHEIQQFVITMQDRSVPVR